MTPLVEKYRPATLAEVVGQPDAVEQLQLWLADPYPVAFLFEGETGTGKSSAALALAAGLGVDVGQGEFGGLWQIASGEQTGETVRAIVAGMRVRPWSGSGWRVLVVNEADAMSPGAAVVWLDVLENLPQQTAVVFTTNAAGRIPARLRDRCERLRFESGWLLLLPHLQELVDRVWAAEVGPGLAPDAQDFGGLCDERGNASIRRLLQLMQPWVRAKKHPPKPAPVEVHQATVAVPVPRPPAIDRGAAARKAWATRRARAAGRR
jgi:replication factor C subunit 3/5